MATRAAGLLLVVPLALAGCSSTPASLCSPASCAGCCQNEVCVGGTELTACGAGGLACDVCVSGQVCAERCMTSSSGGGAGGGGEMPEPEPDGGVGGGGGSGGGSAGGAGGAGGGGGGVPDAGPNWTNLGAFAATSGATESIDGLNLLSHGGLMQVAFQRKNNTATPPVYVAVTASLAPPAWTTVQLDPDSSGFPQLVAAPNGVPLVNWCGPPGRIHRITATGTVAQPLYTPCATQLAAGPTAGLLYVMRVMTNGVQIEQSTTGGTTWAPYASFPKVNSVLNAQLQVKANGNLIVTYLDDRDSNGTGGPQGDSVVTTEFNGTGWTVLGTGFTVQSFNFDLVIDRMDRPCVVYWKPAVGAVVECHGAGAWAQQGGVAYSSANTPRRFSLVVDSANAFWLAVITGGTGTVQQQGVVTSLGPSGWRRAGHHNGCLTALCPQLGQFELAIGPNDVPYAATTSRFIDDAPTLWRLQ